MPELEHLRPALERNGIDLIGLNVDAEPDADIRGFLRANPVKYPILVGGVPLIENFYATDELSVPLSVVVDEHGTITELIPGWSNETRARFDALAQSDVSSTRQAPKVSKSPVSQSTTSRGNGKR